ncbi:MAG: iron ABC transporter substrate-binding protein [Pseudodesulfovibrio sp.]|uniref:Periplasmic binding protein n=1 Tax=Pseudodesulfovibrio aespoeensis (strain ATCC 700646 / DSM 10631 / Aspo-2) TaxID=643562 RepID=E6VRX4_PSEA9|nr:MULTISPECIES: iron ABC transporter substrate-binding protein [Pseudodesulfovibrio]MBU4192758.1 iron ABC transporter substrate-binding protein [Pseudomonadota bacterium]ADU61907.1 periplasmic binding protein [Pseudodesulfovibrio aespoeensis Aspo-2]MBU4243635.1 iron ABC transporter substrate-binding protein [Pseudomonadota bacterium]MBU4377725.1 iron ABC transporter substrate-binding protein [Pseudomonadota bacterium]MBU4475731.1 iron ABC transporter substrate-binding protein [Pseudomonadota 
MRAFQLLFTVLAAALIILSTSPAQAESRTITDSFGREVVIATRVTKVICSGPGCLRLLTYLQAQNLAVAVDDIEARRRSFDARPYAMANPQFKTLPVFGEFRGHDNPELILSLDPQPQVIFKTSPTRGHDPVELQSKTGIPVVTLDYGTLGKQRPALYQSLRIMGEVLGRQERAEAVIAFMEHQITDLKKRTADIAEQDRPAAYVGGVAMSGPHGFQSTEPGYPPFAFLGVRNLAYREGLTGKDMAYANVAKEMIVQWNPQYLFLDLSTLQLGDSAGGLYELRTDPAYRTLSAVREGRVYGLLPYNWYSQNFASILADAFYIGKLIYPDRFQDVDPRAKADELYAFLVGKPLFDDMNRMFGNFAFTQVPVN